MTFWGKLRFMMGMLSVVLLVGLLVLYLNNSMSTVHTPKADLKAEATTVGVDYPGLVVKQDITEGDKVTKGQVMFTVNSPQLVADLNSRAVEATSLPFTVEPGTQNIIVKANGDGVVEKINYRVGSYAPTGSVIATIDTIDTLYISAHFHLTPPDYARVKRGNEMNITFPDNTKLTATVYNISLVNDGGVVDTVVKARIKNPDDINSRFSIGTPVEASLKLTQRTWYQGLIDMGRKLFKPTAQ